jgi:hypothetical protein
MSKIWSFGCSFTSGYLQVPKESSYPHLIANELGYGCENLARPGNCNDKIFFDLLKNEENIKEGDIILYQFSSFNRVGFFTGGNGNYFSSAGIPELGPSHKIKEEPFRKFKIEDLEVLLDYIKIWNPQRHKFSIENALNLLKIIERERSIRYYILFLTGEISIENREVLRLPYGSFENNLSLNDYLDHERLTIGHEYPEIYQYGDTHPGFKGHENISSKILNKLKKWE